MNTIKEISIKAIKGVRIGNETDSNAGTGTTVIYFPDGATCGIDVSGGGPASSENLLASPLTNNLPLNAIVLSGGSAYGLAASQGVRQCLEDNGLGYDTGFAKVALVAQSCLYDLSYRSATVRPDYNMGYSACLKALHTSDDSCGNVGAGCGATVGKLCGMQRSMKSGLGIHAIQVGQLTIAAIVAVNALGDIYNPSTGKKVAGLLNEDLTGFADSLEVMCQSMLPHDYFTANTTIGAVITNAAFDKAGINKVASMTRNAYARCINPVGTMADGDTIYAACTNEIQADINVVGTLAAYVMQQAILKCNYHRYTESDNYEY